MLCDASHMTISDASLFASDMWGGRYTDDADLRGSVSVAKANRRKPTQVEETGSLLLPSAAVEAGSSLPELGFISQSSSATTRAMHFHLSTYFTLYIKMYTHIA